jgi:hypothetical protein
VNRSAIAAAVLAGAAGLAAGWVGRSEIARRHRGTGATLADRMRTAFADKPASAWTLHGLRQILDAAEPDDVAESVTVRFSSPHGGALYAQMKRGQAQPELRFLAPSGGCEGRRPMLARLDVPDDPRGCA